MKICIKYMYMLHIFVSNDFLFNLLVNENFLVILIGIFQKFQLTIGMLVVVRLKKVVTRLTEKKCVAINRVVTFKNFQN